MREALPSYSRSIGRSQSHAGELDFLWKVYRWMSIGLAITGTIAWFVAGTPAIVEALFSSRWIFYAFMIVQIGMVLVFATRASRMSFSAAATLFTTYAALNGVTMSVIFLAYTAASVGQVFFVSAGAFAGLAVYGATTKRDLSAMGQFMAMGLIGLVIASVVNIFLQSSAVYWISTYAGVLIFAGLTAYDNQKLRRMYAQQGEAGNLALQGALTLYLDFVNLFLMLLRLFGKRR